MLDTSRQIERAEKFIQKGKYEAALREYLLVLEAQPSNHAVAHATAEVYGKLGRWSEAAKLMAGVFERQLEKGEDDGAITTYRKLAGLRKPTPDEALHFARLVQKSDPKQAIQAAELAKAGFRRAGLKLQVFEALDLLASLDSSAERIRELAQTAEELGKRIEAAAFYMKVAEREPGSTGMDALARAYQLDPANQRILLAYVRALLESRSATARSRAIEVLEPVVKFADQGSDARVLYGQALLEAGRVLDAAPYVVEGLERGQDVKPVLVLIGSLLNAGQERAAIDLARKLERHSVRAGNRREFIGRLQALADQHPGRISFIEFMAEVYNGASYESDYCRMLLQLYDLHYANGDFLKAADCLDRAAEVDAYEHGHYRRLELLRGKIDQRRYSTIANRFEQASQAASNVPAPEVVEQESTVLEDLLLQAEFFLQYKLPTRAIERLERIRKLYPDEEAKNPKLAGLIHRAGLKPKKSSARIKPAPGTQGEKSAAIAVEEPSPPSHDLSRVNEIVRNLLRQGNVKSVLFTAVNDIGRQWDVGRCMALLAAPGKPPSIALEYCVSSLPRSDIRDVVKLLGLLQPLVVAHGPIIVPAPGSPRRFAPLRRFAAELGLDSVLAMPLLEGDQHVGMLLLAESGRTREWPAADIALLKTVCDQLSLAVANARLRALMRDLSLTEEKSGLLKRECYFDVLLAELRRGLDQHSNVSLVLLKVTPDDSVPLEPLMQHAGQLVCSHIRQNDSAIRYDGNTIALVLADTAESGAILAFEKLRRILGEMPVPGTERTVLAIGAVAEAVMQPAFEIQDIATELVNRAEYALQSVRASQSHVLALPSRWKGVQVASSR